MSKLKQGLLKFQALTLRERFMAVAATLAVLYFLTDFFLLGPQMNKGKALQQQISQQKVEFDGLAKVMASGAADNKPADALARERAERDELLARIAKAEAFVGLSAKGAPMSELVRAMIGASPDLTLVSLRTLPAEVFSRPVAPTAAPAKAASAAQPSVAATPLTIYKHGVEVVIKGTYPALLAYLQTLQRNPNKMFWTNVKLDVVSYPEATLRMTVFTVSDRAESPLG